MGYRSEDFYEKNNCTVLYGKIAEKIDPLNKTVTLNDGTLLSYDSLCVAAGSQPFIPQFEGLDTVTDKFSFMTLDDALSLEQA
jgi:NAD(P)H-nitrite reductase large subunit